MNFSGKGWYSFSQNSLFDYNKYDYFWLSDFTLEEGRETLTYFALRFNEGFYGACPFQVPIDNVFIPIRLVQDIIPIEDVE